MKKILSALTILVLIVSSTAFASGIGKILNNPVFQAVDSSGIPLAGGLLYSYEPGTTTPKATYSDKECTVANTNPVVLGYSGQATIYLSGPTKINLTASDGTQISNYPMDYVSGMGMDHYSPDYNATDQGLTGNSNTIKYYVDTIGSDTGTIILRHNSGSATTTYVLSTSETIPSNITLKIEPGAIITVATGVTLTINGPLVAEPTKIFSLVGTGVVTGAPLADKIFAEWFGTGGTDDQDAINLALSSFNQCDLLGIDYNTDDSIELPTTPFVFKGDYTKTKIYASNTTNAIYFNAGDALVNLENSYFGDFQLFNKTGSTNGINFTGNGAVAGAFSHLEVGSIWIEDFTGKGFYVSCPSWLVNIKSIRALECEGGGVYFDGAAAGTYSGLSQYYIAFIDAYGGDYPVYIDAFNDSVIDYLHASDGDTACCHIENALKDVFRKIHVEKGAALGLDFDDNVQDNTINSIFQRGNATCVDGITFGTYFRYNVIDTIYASQNTGDDIAVESMTGCKLNRIRLDDTTITWPTAGAGFANNVIFDPDYNIDAYSGTTSAQGTVVITYKQHYFNQPSVIVELASSTYFNYYIISHSTASGRYTGVNIKLLAEDGSTAPADEAATVYITPR